MSKAYFAHSTPGKVQSDWQALSDHLFAVASLASEMGGPLGIGRACFAAGLFHDLGKYNPIFQRRLAGENLRIDHSTAGAKLLREVAEGVDRQMAEIIAYAILGHHAGLPDRLNETNACYNWRIDNSPEIDPVWRDELGETPRDLAPMDILRKIPSGRNAGFALSVFGRMVFSCLVDADFRDTEAFYSRLEGRVADRQWPLLASFLPDLSARYERHMAGFSADGDLNRLRREVLSHVRGKAGEKPGLFTLTVPTGGGKTLASLGFALDHARIHGHRRIIYAIPFTSIIEQTAAIFRQVLEQEGDSLILEHHSAIDEDRESRRGREERQQHDKLKLAMEDWAAPIVVTTNVQLFESLFASRTSRARKLHNIAGSIIILDEAQTLPRHYLFPVMRMLEALVEQYGCTIILCTATQPALGARPDFQQGLALEGRELAPDPNGLAGRLARATIRHGGTMDNDALIAALEENEQALVIVNSRRHALELFRDAEAARLSGLVHLSTRLCAVHRREILGRVKARLKAGGPCRVIATSLVEAGVDIDFPCVLRAEAGLDQIVQAAGRCNREGGRRREESFVTVFDPADYAPPTEIKGMIGDMKRMIGKHDDLLSLPAIEDYFREVYWRKGEKGLDGKGILDRFTVTLSGTDFAYRSVAEEFRIIESGMEPVVIPYDDKARQAVADLGIENISSGRLARVLQSYIVQVPPKARALLVANGHARFERPDLRGDQFMLLQTASLYGPELGLLWEEAEYLAAENMIF
ncbi:CRISPR-associated helicase/endonuclease Cas3 [Martelella sp. AD-3]|uniref:CRISPR-associated helicase/endonuclease Cas3 n=1 Tax=Martelella sp. AD-3 TaxID=686597 RepID=UPI0004638AD2|nr:CRISPR-associated helicase/endonuclease Cas3 [Martelella sp. AD-3]AMM84769.1 CRISPR-associated protein Cas3 [Martelella sp. AD-3]